jgi:hypothetical protein
MFSNCTTFTNKLNHLFQHDNSVGVAFSREIFIQVLYCEVSRAEYRVKERENGAGETLTHVIKFGRRQTAESCIERRMKVLVLHNSQQYLTLNIRITSRENVYKI